MARRSRTWDEEVARWTRVGELGMEAALRRIGCPEHRISKVLEKSNKTIFESFTVQRKSKSNVGETSSPTSRMSETAHLSEDGHVDSDDFTELEPTSGKSNRADSGKEGHVDLDDSKPDRYTELERSMILATVGLGMSHVKQVYLGRDVTENEATAFCVNLTSNKNIKQLSVAADHLLFSNRTGCTLLGNALATNLAIEMLNLREVGVGGDGVSCLMKGLQRNRTLERLDLSWNPLGNEGVTLVAECLGNAKFPLRTLDLSDVGVGSEGVLSLVKSLHLCETLESLVLSWNPLGHDGVNSVADLLASSTTLKTLDLRSVGCGLEGAKHLSSALARNTSLAELSFGMFYKIDVRKDSRYKETQSREYTNLEGNAMLGIDLVEGYRVILESC